ncbi:MAG: serine/threonine protein kinase [Actinomycetota bacterium]|nr:serine/threonine protein kinase [Actinomycetota bacterium]
MRKGDVINGRYELLDPLGSGGMAFVWGARDIRLDRPVAVKLIAPQFAEDPEFLVRFFSEGQSVARINHPNVVSVLDFGEVEGRPFLVIEFVSGGSLNEAFEGPLLPERALELVAEAARGAGAAHALGIVHRDIKPPNILMTERGQAKLADFGIASIAGGEKFTATGAAIGSPHYVSPEQVSGRQPVPASDVYSLGVVLYELLTGQKLFEHTNVTAIAIAHIEEEPEPPSASVEDVDPALDALVLRCLEKDPADRFQDGNELADAIDSVMSGDADHTTFMPMLHDDEDDELDHLRSPTGRRVLLGSALALLLAIVIGVTLVAASGSPDESAEADPSVESPAASREPNRKPSPSPTASTAATSTTSATPSPVPEEDGAEAGSGSTDGGGGGGTVGAGGGGQPAPSAAPSAAPSVAASPSPTETDLTEAETSTE